jgi:hypothetical protein
MHDHTGNVMCGSIAIGSRLKILREIMGCVDCRTTSGGRVNTSTLRCDALVPNHSRPPMDLRLSSYGTCESRSGLVANEQLHGSKISLRCRNEEPSSFGLRACANAEHTDHTAVLYELLIIIALTHCACLPPNADPLRPV